MKILHINTTVDPVDGGGFAERTFQLTRFSAKVGLKSHLLVFDQGLTQERIQTLHDMKVKVLALPSLSKRFFIPKNSFKEIYYLIKEVDIIHIMGHWSTLNVIVYLFAQWLKKPYVTCPAGSLLIYGRSVWIKKFFNFLIGKRIMRHASGYIAVTADEMPLFNEYNINSEQVRVIPNGFDESDYFTKNDIAFREKFKIGDAPFILFVGRLHSIKGPDLLLRAFAQIKNDFPEYHLVVAGPDDGMHHMLEIIAEETKMENRIHFLGYLDKENKSMAYHAADLLAIPSRKEAMSIVALEAGATGTPVLLTDQCGFDEISEVGGGIVSPATIEGLQEGLRLCLKDSHKLKIMGKKLHDFVIKKYEWSNIIENYRTLYAKIISG